jgi:F0F1-type ATP synthase delta subunit
MESSIDLSDFFFTKKQANDFIQSVGKIIDQLFEVNFHLETVLTNEFGIDKKDKFMNLLRDLKMNNLNNEELKKILLILQDNVRKLPVVSLTLAFEPSEAVLKALQEWFLFNLKKQISIDVQIDKKLIAGATINCNGKFKDYSIKPLFEQLLDQKINSNNKSGIHNINQSINVNG